MSDGAQSPNPPADGLRCAHTERPCGHLTPAEPAGVIAGRGPARRCRARHRLHSPAAGQRDDAEPGTDFIRLSRPVPLALIAGRGHYESVVERVMNAERSVWIATANLKELMVEDHRAQPGRRRTLGRAAGYRSVLAVFADQVARGIEIRILHAGEASRPFRAELARHPELGQVRAAGGSFEMRLCPRVHFKAVVIDGAEVYLGSANWTGAGLGAKGERRRNFELGVMSRDDLLLDEVQRYFDVLWHGTPCRACRLRHMCPMPLDGV